MCWFHLFPGTRDLVRGWLRVRGAVATLLSWFCSHSLWWSPPRSEFHSSQVWAGMRMLTNGCLSLHQRQSQGPSWLRSPVCASSRAMVASAPLVTLRCSLPALSAPSEPGAPPGSILPFSSSPRLQLLWATLPLFSLIPFVFLSKPTHNFYFTKDILSCFPILYIKKLFCNFRGMRWEWAIKTCTRCGIIM